MYLNERREDETEKQQYTHESVRACRDKYPESAVMADAKGAVGDKRRRREIDCEETFYFQNFYYRITPKPRRRDAVKLAFSLFPPPSYRARSLFIFGQTRARIYVFVNGDARGLCADGNRRQRGVSRLCVITRQNDQPGRCCAPAAEKSR